MRVSVSEMIRKLASILIKAQDGESPYLNIPFYQQRIDPTDPSQMIGDGPPSMYNDTDKKDKLKNVEDMRRQGPRPGPVDSLVSPSTVPVNVTQPGNPKEDAQGEVSDNVKAKGRYDDDEYEDSGLDNNRETTPFDPGKLMGNPFRS